MYVSSEWRVCVAPPCPVSSPSWADQLCAQQRRGHQLARWRGYVRSVHTLGQQKLEIKILVLSFPLF